MNKEAPLD